MDEEMTDLETIRKEIDALDRQIVPLLAKRQEWVVKAGHVKRDDDEDAVRAPDRVEEVVRKVLDLADAHGLAPSVAERTYRPMIQAYIELQLDVHRSLQQESGSSPD